MEFLIKFTDTDPDTGDISQEKVVASAYSEVYAKAIVEALNKDDGSDPNREYSFLTFKQRIKEVGDWYHDRVVMSSFFGAEVICPCCGSITNSTTSIEHDTQNHNLDMSVCTDCYVSIANYWSINKPKKMLRE